jgi:SAM-dependent methyltransferase
LNDGWATERWNRAQIAERKFWVVNQKRWAVENPNCYWRGVLRHGFNLDYKFFEGKSVLEVGCGPTGLIFELDNSRFRVGLEPMELEGLVSDTTKRSIIRKGIGEDMPFEDASFDTVISFNALDHSAHPSKVVQEIHRVLKRDGELLLWIYVLRQQYMFLRGLLNRIDKPHPHHFTRDDLIGEVLDDHFDIQYCKEEEGTGLPNNTIKKALANRMMKTFWARAKKKRYLV